MEGGGAFCYFLGRQEILIAQPQIGFKIILRLNFAIIYFQNGLFITYLSMLGSLPHFGNLKYDTYFSTDIILKVFLLYFNVKSGQ